MRDINDFEHHDTTMGQPRRRSMQDPTRTVMPVTGYRCVTHNFTTRSKVGLQLHTNNNIAGCEIDVLRAEPALPPKPEPAEPPHVGPQHEHDCDACIFLGSRSYAGQMHDLFWCPPNKFNERGNLIARRGPLGDYVSGMDFIDREPMLAVAAILALKAGHMTRGDVLGTRVHHIN